MKLGLLKVGVPQPWEKSKKNLNYVREAGVRQFISTYNRVKNLKGDELLWGDEVEYGIFILDDENKKIRLSLRAKEVCVYIMFVYSIVTTTQNIISIELLCFYNNLFLFQIMDNLNRNEEIHSYENEGCNWVPEYGAWMIEATPSRREYIFFL